LNSEDFRWVDCDEVGLIMKLSALQQVIKLERHATRTSICLADSFVHSNL